jgi:hypothetical protein
MTFDEKELTFTISLTEIFIAHKKLGIPFPQGDETQLKVLWAYVRLVEKGKGNTIGLKPKSWRHFADGYLLTCERVVLLEVSGPHIAGFREEGDEP